MLTEYIKPLEPNAKFEKYKTTDTKLDIYN